MTFTIYFNISLLIFVLMFLYLDIDIKTSIAKKGNMTLSQATAVGLLAIAVASLFWLPISLYLIIMKIIERYNSK